MDNAESLNRSAQVSEQGLDGIELATRMELTAKRVADVMNTASRPVLDRERAASCTAKCAAIVGIIARGWREIGESRAGTDERRELAIVEQVRSDTAATRTAIERAALHVGHLRSHAQLRGLNFLREPLFVIAQARVAHALTKRDELVGARRRLPKLDQQPLDAHEHALTVALHLGLEIAIAAPCGSIQQRVRLAAAHIHRARRPAEDLRVAAPR